MFQSAPSHVLFQMVLALASMQTMAGELPHCVSDEQTFAGQVSRVQIGAAIEAWNQYLALERASFDRSLGHVDDKHSTLRLQEASGIRNKANQPASVFPRRAKATVILIHGLFRDPSNMRGLEELYFSEGFNVLNVRLPGHVEGDARLRAVTHQEWQKQVDMAIDLAKVLGEKVILAGHSTGGTLAFDAAIRRPADVAAVMGFAPALNVSATILTASSVGSLLDITRVKQEEQFRRVSPSRTAKAVDQLIQSLDPTNQGNTRGATEVNSSLEKIRPVFSRMHAPIFLTQGLDDFTIDTWANREGMKLMKNPGNRFLEFPMGSEVGHGNLIHFDKNPRSAELRAGIREFLDVNFPNRRECPAGSVPREFVPGNCLGPLR